MVQAQFAPPWLFELADRLSELAGDSPSHFVVSFSGGPDSTALLVAMTTLAARQGHLVTAVHFDHGLDTDAPYRARAAVGLARRLGVSCSVERLRLGPTPPGQSLEARAREARYTRLEDHRERSGASFSLTAHHADDQAETLILRLLFGTRWPGLVGIQPRFHRCLRPLLTVPRAALSQALETAGIQPVTDPTNDDLDRPRNRIRHHLLPTLTLAVPDLTPRLVELASTTRRIRHRLTNRLASLIDLHTCEDGSVILDRHALEALPSSLCNDAIALVGRRVGLIYPPAQVVVDELARQLRRGGRVGCDWVAGWRFEADRDHVYLRRRILTEPFSYILEVPGTIAVPSMMSHMRADRRPLASWMLRSHPNRAALATDAVHLLVRSRIPGDRMQPFGAARSQRVKELLIARRVPRHVRDRLPMVVVDGLVAWIPGVAIAEPFRITDHTQACTVELERWTDDHEPTPHTRNLFSRPGVDYTASRRARSVVPSPTHSGVRGS